MPTRIPIGAVTTRNAGVFNKYWDIVGIIIGLSKFITVVNSEIERDFTGATVFVGVLVGIDSAFLEDCIDIVGIVFPTVGVAAGSVFFKVVAGTQLQVENKSAVA